MKLLFVLDHFGMGGAQRQMVELACGLKRLNHEVEFFIYFPQSNFFRHRVEASGIPIHEFSKRLGFSIAVVNRLVGLMRAGGFDAVLAYLNSPIIYAELAKLIARGPVLVVSERCSSHDDASATGAFMRRLLHRLADGLVTNSQSHADWLRAKRWLPLPIYTIYNGFDLSVFVPENVPIRVGEQIRLLAVGRICPQKNLLNLIEGLQCFYARHGFAPSVTWVGKRDVSANGDEYGELVLNALNRYPRVKERWQWLGEQADMVPLLRDHDALIHPSRYEGLPNAVCEALAMGKPVLAADVCDHSLLVAEGKRGFLFDPESPGSIAGALQKLIGLSREDRAKFSENAREFAENQLSLGRMVLAYEQLFRRLVGR